MQPNWKPLEELLGVDRCAGFMFMGRVNGINVYKHGIARTYLCLDDRGSCYARLSHRRFEPADFWAELEKLEAALEKEGETLESPYDDEYINRRDQMLSQAGVPLLLINAEWEAVTVN